MRSRTSPWSPGGSANDDAVGAGAEDGAELLGDFLRRTRARDRRDELRGDRVGERNECRAVLRAHERTRGAEQAVQLGGQGQAVRLEVADRRVLRPEITRKAQAALVDRGLAITRETDIEAREHLRTGGPACLRPAPPHERQLGPKDECRGTVRDDHAVRDPAPEAERVWAVPRQVDRDAGARRAPAPRRTR